jgi:peptidoglycan/LPS O-acetylase OafA/YrhL
VIKAIVSRYIPLMSLYSMPLAYIDAFSMGILVGFYHDKIKLNKYVIYFFTFVALWTIIVGEIKNAWTYRHYLQVLLSSAFLIYVATLNKNILNVPILGPLLHFIGVRSYFIYLMHFIIHFIIKTPIKYFIEFLSLQVPYLKIYMSNPIHNFSITHLILLIITIGLADLFYRYVEKPFIKNNKDKVVWKAVENS